MSTTRKPRRTVVIVAAVVGAAVLAGVGSGTALALWDDDESFGAQIGTGMVGFAVGTPAVDYPATATGVVLDADNPADPNVLPFTFGPAQAQQLEATGEVAVPIQVDARADGNKGLRYSVQMPTFDSGSFLGNSTVTVFPVPAPDQCAVQGAASQPPPTFATYTPADPDGDGTFEPGTAGWDTTELASEPVDANYAGEWVATEYWCVTAILGDMPDEGAYTNTATVQVEVDGDKYNAEDRWGATVTTAADPAAEPRASLRFIHQTFRPGE